MLPILTCAEFSHLKGNWQLTCFISGEKKIVLDQAEMQNNFWWTFLTAEKFADKNVQRKNHGNVFACDRFGYIYICIYIFFTRRVYYWIAIRLQVKGGNFQPSRFPRETNKGATHFKEMMIPLFERMRKNFVLTKLGWVVVSVTCFSPYAKINKRTTWKL